jgi:hypothetical protein
MTFQYFSNPQQLCGLSSQFHRPYHRQDVPLGLLVARPAIISPYQQGVVASASLCKQLLLTHHSLSSVCTLQLPPRVMHYHVQL